MKMAILFTFHWQSVCLSTFTISNLTHHHHQPLHPQHRFQHRHFRLVDTDLYNLVTKKVVCEKTKKDLVEQTELGQNCSAGLWKIESNLVTKDKSLSCDEEA